VSRPSLPPAVAVLIDAPRPVEEFLARVRAPVSDEELAATRELVAWFTRRYPTVRERLDYVRRAHARWRGAPRGSTGPAER
jgi:hypothetical protein